MIEVEIDDPIIGKRTLADTWTALIFDQLRVLREIRKRGTSPHHGKRLNEDIRSYEILLQQPDPEAACAKYAELADRHRRGGDWSKAKRDILEEMGIWK